MWKMKLNAANVTAAVAVVMMLIAAATWIYQLGQLSEQVESLSVQMEDLREEIRLMREDMRRGNQQLLYSLANHTHDDDGNALFTMPPGMEPTGANPNQRTPAQ